jgi:hypothetical protein
MRLLADENVRGAILDGVRLRNPDVDIIRVQDTEIYEADDPIVLEWAAQQGRIIVSHDVNTLAGYAYDRVKAGLPMLGVVEIHQDLPTGQAIEELLIFIGASNPAEWENQVVFLPL